jgi:hypothetical protein
MKNLGKILSLSKRVIAQQGTRRRERVERQPVAELMEPRALLSGLETGVAPAIPSHHAGAALLIPITESPSLHVVYQTNHSGGAIGLARSAPVVIASAAQGVDATTMDASTADDSGDDSDDDGDGDDDGDDDGDGDGDGDENDDENDPNPGP